MAHSAGRKEEGRRRVLAAAGRGFRRHGFGGIGVDGLARQAGVTSGAFYAHYPSKAAAFAAAVEAGMTELADGIARLQAEHGAGWLEPFVDFYLGERRLCDASESCALQSLAGDVARADPETRAAFERDYEMVVAMVAAGLSGTESVRVGKARALLALLAGSVSQARAVADPALSDSIATATKRAALAIMA